MIKLSIERLSREKEEDFYRVHNDECCGGWCFCSAWWYPNWEGFGERTSTENRALREQLFKNQVYDGYIVYFDGQPRGWCQVGKRDQFPKQVSQFGLELDPDTWAISCMAIPSQFQGMGLSHKILALIIEDLRARGVKRLQAFPKAAPDLPKDEIWTGPLSIFVKAGFKVVKADNRRPVLELTL